jgi:hypothetical protein
MVNACNLYFNKRSCKVVSSSEYVCRWLHLHIRVLNGWIEVSLRITLRIRKALKREAPKVRVGQKERLRKSGWARKKERELCEYFTKEDNRSARAKEEICSRTN